MVSCVARADPRPTANKRTSSSDNLALRCNNKKYTEVYVSVKATYLSERLAVVCVWDLGTGMSNVVDETENVTS